MPPNIQTEATSIQPAEWLEGTNNKIKTMQR